MGRFEASDFLILAYHSVCPDAQHSISVSQANFKRQMKWLKDRGFSGVTLASLLADPTPKYKCCITFDDGWEDNLIHAKPILDELGWVGVVFAATEAVDFSDRDPAGARKKYAAEGLCPPMNWSQLKELIAAGWEIGAHSCTHPILTKIREEEAQKEIANSKAILEEQLQVEVPSFCYPSSQTNDAIANMVKAAGYKAGVLSWAQKDEFDIYRLRRVAVYRDDGMVAFQLKLRMRNVFASLPQVRKVFGFAKKILSRET
jgi:peptidoglycan/xylan/chitin deacetylase (PgdA/CDA1 family)